MCSLCSWSLDSTHLQLLCVKPSVCRKLNGRADACVYRLCFKGFLQAVDEPAALCKSWTCLILKLIWLLMSGTVNSSIQAGIMFYFQINFSFCTVDCESYKKRIDPDALFRERSRSLRVIDSGPFWGLFPSSSVTAGADWCRDVLQYQAASISQHSPMNTPYPDDPIHWSHRLVSYLVGGLLDVMEQWSQGTWFLPLFQRLDETNPTPEIISDKM